MSTTQPEALRLAEGLESIFISEEIHATKAQKIAAELRRLHARIADLESRLVKEAARSADEKRRADQMTEQHRMQAAMNAEARAKLASIGAGYTAADMATAAAQGFRDGVASVAASAGSEPVAWLVGGGRIFVDKPFLSRDAALRSARERADGAKVTPLYTHPSPPEGMVGGWQSIATAPKDGTYLLLWEQYSTNPFVGCWAFGAWRVSHEHVDAEGGWDGAIVVDSISQDRITHWMPMPPAPSSDKGVAL